jgi:copper resistance protein D
MAGSYALFGTMLLSAFFLPGTTPPMKRLAWASLAVVLAAGIAWFLLQSADMASAGNFAQTFAALPIVVQWTQFGHLILLRALLSILAVLSFQAGYPRIAALFGGAAIVAEAWLGHGGAMTGTIGTALLISSILHLSAGAAWLGSLPALFLMIALLPPTEAATLARRYSPFGIACVLALIASAIVQFIFLIGSPSALFTSLYGRVALVKILLLAGLILLAALNRYRLAPALLDASRPDAKTKLLTSIGAEIALGLTALLAAGLLLNLAPPTMATMLGGSQ